MTIPLPRYAQKVLSKKCKMKFQIGGLGQIKRTVANKREKRHSSDEEVVPKKSSRSVTEKEKGRAIYKTALNGKVHSNLLF